MMDILVLTAITMALFCANAVVSLRVAQSPMFERRQVIGQIALVWLLPVLGFAIVGLFLRHEQSMAKPPDARADIETDEKGVLLDSPLTGHQHHE